MKLIKNFSIYTISSIISNGISFLLIPILTTNLSTSDYGTLGMFTILVTLTNTLISISSYGAIQSEFYHTKKENLSRYIFNALILNLILFVIFYFIIQSIKGSITSLTAINSFGLRILPIIAFLNILSQILLIIFQSEDKPIQFGVLNITQGEFNLIISIIFVVFYHYNWGGRALGLLITSILFSIISFFIFYRKGCLKFSFSSKYLQLYLNDFVCKLNRRYFEDRLFERLFIANITGL